MLQRFCRCLAQSNFRFKSAQVLHEDTYAAASPMSIFGSLGVVSAGFKTLVACFSFGDIEGAKILGNMGFKPQGENLSLIMVEAGKGKNTGRYIIETRMDELIKKLHIDKTDNWGIPQVHCLGYQDDGRDRAPMCFQHRCIYLFKSRCQQPEEKCDMGLPCFACYRRLHHSHAHSTSHTTTNNHSFRPIYQNETSCLDETSCVIQMSRQPATQRNNKWLRGILRLHGCCYFSSLSVS
jgi:hypothetical protein